MLSCAYSIHNGEFEHCSRLSSIVVHQRYWTNILLAKDNEYFKVISQEIKVELVKVEFQVGLPSGIMSELVP